MKRVVETTPEVSVTLEWLEREPRLSKSSVIIPNCLARSRVFSSQPNHITRTVYTTDTEITVRGEDKIYQVGGAQLTQAEETIWLVIVRAALSAKIDPSTQNKVLVEFKETDMLRTLGQAETSQYRASLRTAISYLGRARFKIELAGGGHIYEGNLLDLERRTKRGETGYKVWLDMRLSTLFLTGWSYLNFEHRLKLRNSPLAQWLLSFYSTHKDPIAINHEILKKLADRIKMREDKWLAALHLALHELSEATGWSCKLDKDGNIRVSKKKVSLPPAEVANIEGSMDERLFETWLLTLTIKQLENELKKLGFELHRVNFATPIELRNMVRRLLLEKPELLEHRLVALRKKAKTSNSLDTLA